MSHYDHPAFLIIFTFNHSGEKCLKVRPQSSSLILQIHLFQRILIRRLMGTMAIHDMVESEDEQYDLVEAHLQLRNLAELVRQLSPPALSHVNT